MVSSPLGWGGGVDSEFKVRLYHLSGFQEPDSYCAKTK